MPPKMTAGPSETPKEEQPPAAYGAAAMVDLCDLILFSGCEVLNAAGFGGVDRLLKQGLRDQPELTVESDADEQLLLNLSFSTTVKIHSFSLNAPDGDPRAPKQVKFFANKTSMNFDDAESGAAEQELELTAEQLGRRIELRFVKFQNVNQLSIFIGSNQGDEESTVLSGIKLWGAPLATTNMSKFKRVVGEAGEGE